MMKNIWTILFLIVTTIGYSQDWFYVGKSSDGSESYMKSSHSQSFYKKVWVKTTNVQLTVTKNGKKIVYKNASMMVLYEFDCDAVNMNICSYTSYNSANKLIESFSHPDFEKNWEAVIPDTVGEMLFKAACKYF